MKTKIIRALQESGIAIGDEIPAAMLVDIRRSLASDSPEGYEKFYAAWYAVTDDGPGFGTRPNLPRRIK